MVGPLHEIPKKNGMSSRSRAQMIAYRLENGIPSVVICCAQRDMVASIANWGDAEEGDSEKQELFLDKEE